MEQPTPETQTPMISFNRLVQEHNSWYAIYSSPKGLEFKVTPMDQTVHNRTYVDLTSHIRRQQAFSAKTFGPLIPGPRLLGVIDHIKKEMKEIELDPTNLGEWIDFLILSIDGASRAGHSPEAIVEALVAKQTKNENRQWPDWRTMEPGKAIEHIRTPEEQAIKAQELAREAQMPLNFDGNGTPV